jgi:hypothetical protein
MARRWVDQVQEGGALLDPAPGHAGRVVAENGFLGIIALAEADTAPAAQVYGRQNEHGCFLVSIRAPPEGETPRGAYPTPSQAHSKGRGAGLQDFANIW